MPGRSSQNTIVPNLYIHLTLYFNDTLFVFLILVAHLLTKTGSEFTFVSTVKLFGTDSNISSLVPGSPKRAICKV